MPVVHLNLHQPARTIDVHHDSAQAIAECVKKGFSRDIRVSKSDGTHKEHGQFVKLGIGVGVSAFRQDFGRSTALPQQTKLAVR